MTALRIVCVLALIGMPALTKAQEGTGRLLELPAHRALIERARVSDPVPFVTDGCSGGMTAIWTGIAAQFPSFAALHGDLPPWEICCQIHDWAYHSMGRATDAEASYAARRHADEELRACVSRTGAGDLSQLGDAYGVGEDTIREAFRGVADAMYLAVRLGGLPCSGLPWRWGYGYPQCSVVENVIPDF
jgi:hypothetical protein